MPGDETETPAHAAVLALLTCGTQLRTLSNAVGSSTVRASAIH
jgi:hypothetical protein